MPQNIATGKIHFFELGPSTPPTTYCNQVKKVLTSLTEIEQSFLLGLSDYNREKEMGNH